MESVLGLFTKDAAMMKANGVQANLIDDLRIFLRDVPLIFDHVLKEIQDAEFLKEDDDELDIDDVIEECEDALMTELSRFLLRHGYQP